MGWLAVPRDWIANFGEIVEVLRAGDGAEVYSGRVFRFFGEALRQAGDSHSQLDAGHLGSDVHHRVPVRDRGRVFQPLGRCPAYAGVFAAWCDLRELVPYAFGYMMAAKVGTGIVAEIGSMRITDEIDALEVMGIASMTLPVRDEACWRPGWCCRLCTSPRIGAGFFASYLAVVEQIGEVSSGRVLC